jgi:hypothetical protein
MNDKKYWLIILLPECKGIGEGNEKGEKMKLSEKTLHYQYKGEHTKWIF